jgi:5'-methylthioadenosine phosphorylase
MADAIPRTPFALLSGSAGWGVPFPEGLDEPGVTVLARDLTFDTPWGQAARWQLIEIDGSATADGRPRQVLNVFSHGWPDDAIDHSVHRRVAWVLAQAGARKVLADSTCGSLNRGLRPRDFVVPFDVLDFTQTQYSTVPGRMRQVCLASQMFCPLIGKALEATASALWPAPGRVYGHAHQLVVAHNWGPRFTSRAEARAYQMLGGDVINQSIGPEASAVREIGACFASLSYIVCYEDGIVGGRWEGVDAIHADLKTVAPRISLRTIAGVDLEAPCGCAALRLERPADYLDAAPRGSR